MKTPPEVIHPARTKNFLGLWTALQEAKAAKLVTECETHDGLYLYCYSNSCVYERKWDETTLLARGLIVSPRHEKVIATPFPKFFNVGELQEPLPHLPFETYEKLDGSLIILFNHEGRWRTATKGSFYSDQARWAKEWIQRFDLNKLDPETTYLLEAIYPENKIVIHYPFSGLVFLTAYNGGGRELLYTELTQLANQLGWRVAERYAFTSITELVEKAKTLPSLQEGFVVRFSNGLRVKVKGEEYCRIHRLISQVTPLALWEELQKGSNLQELRKQLPEEFLTDFDSIVSILNKELYSLLGEIVVEYSKVKDLTDKELGLRLDTIPPKVRRFLFPFRKNNGDILNSKVRSALFQSIRPAFNRLPGYQPSSSINRLADDL